MASVVQGDPKEATPNRGLRASGRLASATSTSHPATYNWGDDGHYNPSESRLVLRHPWQGINHQHIHQPWLQLIF